ncbi:hypothetical protein T10_11252 [Trichinella papuae]|uniref:Uncharacterized protein n=1 Tax=Trichinella papuae TaxID=268474 RepID=A0A0V1MAM8_9BILA|nr:hypothetical protein T10_11252 [Trichinella papuae]
MLSNTGLKAVINKNLQLRMQHSIKWIMRNALSLQLTTIMNGDAVVSALFCFCAYYLLGNWIRRQISHQYIVRLIQGFLQIILNTISKTNFIMTPDFENLNYIESAVQDSGNEQIKCHEPTISQRSIDSVESRDKDQLAIDNRISDLKNCDEKDSPPSPEPPLMTINENSKNDTNELNGQAIEEQRINMHVILCKSNFKN